MNVILVANHDYPSALDAAYLLQMYLQSEGITSCLAPSYHELDACIKFQQRLADSQPALIVALGGDGTILRAARFAHYREIPILGLSFGHIGFLAGGGNKEIIKSVSEALSGDMHVSRRSTLRANLYYQYEDIAQLERSEVFALGLLKKTDTSGVYEAFALNELSLTRGNSGKMLSIDFMINGYKLDSIRGDGMVIATATGSTGYALSAGGPIVSPDFKGMVCVPLAAHTLSSRAVLSSSSDVVRLNVGGQANKDSFVYLDGVALSGISAPHAIELTKGPGDCLLLNRLSESFYAAVARVFYGGKS